MGERGGRAARAGGAAGYAGVAGWVAFQSRGSTDATSSEAMSGNDDDDDLGRRALLRAPPKRRGRPTRAGEPSVHRVEVRFTLLELRTLRRLAASNGRPLAEEIRESMLSLAADGNVPDVVRGDALISCR